jgi:hypothetical protein
MKAKIDSVFNNAVKNKQCGFLTDQGKGCGRISVRSPAADVCRNYCLEEKRKQEWFDPRMSMYQEVRQPDSITISGSKGTYQLFKRGDRKIYFSLFQVRIEKK